MGTNVDNDRVPMRVNLINVNLFAVYVPDHGFTRNMRADS